MSVRIGFVGCGSVANYHMSSLTDLENVEMVGFTDVVGEKAEAAAKRYGGKAYEDHQSMYADADLDAVYVCVPPFAHEDQEILAAQAGLAIFVEKPVALSMAKAREIEAAIAQAGVISCAGYQQRYLPTVQKAKQQVAAEDIGLVMGYWLGGFPEVHWWRVMAQSGGQMVEQTTHIVDLARYFAGEIDTVYSSFALRCLQEVEDIDIPDVGCVALEFASGAVGMICNSCCAESKLGIHLILRDISVEIGPSLIIKDKQGCREETFTSPDFPTIDGEFVKAVKSNDQTGILSDYADAVKTLAVSLAANKSAATSQPVKLSEM